MSKRRKSAGRSAGVAAACLSTKDGDNGRMPQLDHRVYFTLNDRSDAAVEHLVGQCQKYLGDHPGQISMAVGRRVSDLNRPVNQDFDVMLHTLFRDRQSHDAYQTADRHLEFIENNKASWANVAVFDSDLC